MDDCSASLKYMKSVNQLWKWKRLLRDPVRAQRKPQLPSQPRRASGFLWAVLFVCLALEGYPVLSCVFSPGGLLIPPNYPRKKKLGGRKGSGARGWAERTEAKAPKTTCHGRQSSHGRLSPQLRHGRQSSELRHGLLSVGFTLEVPVLCSCPCVS